MSHFSRPYSFPLGFRNTWRQLLKARRELERSLSFPGALGPLRPLLQLWPSILCGWEARRASPRGRAVKWLGALGSGGWREMEECRKRPSYLGVSVR